MSGAGGEDRVRIVPVDSAAANASSRLLQGNRSRLCGFTSTSRASCSQLVVPGAQERAKADGLILARVFESGKVVLAPVLRFREINPRRTAFLKLDCLVVGKCERAIALDYKGIVTVL